MERDVSDPNERDWRDKGAVSRVWEQGACGGCWAFTTTTAMEGIHYIWTRKKTALSPQMLLECDPLDQDCAGGNMVTGFQYAVMKGGVSSEVGWCQANIVLTRGSKRILLSTS